MMLKRILLVNGQIRRVAMQIVIEIDEEVYESAKKNTFDAIYSPYDLLELIKNGTPIPDNATVCDIEQIRDEIEKVFCISVITNELRTPMEVKAEILQIIDRYTKGEREYEAKRTIKRNTRGNTTGDVFNGNLPDRR